MNLIVLSARSLQRRRLRNTLCIVIIALSVMLTITVGSTSSRYITAIHGISSFYSGYVVLCAKGSIFIQAIPIGGFLLGNTVDYAKALNETKYAVPLLYLLPAQTSYDLSSIIPSNLIAGIPLGNVTILVGSTPLVSGGRWPQGNNSSREVVVGRFYAEISMLKTGDSLRIKNFNFTIVGILDTYNDILTRTIIMSLPAAQEIYNYGTLINMVLVKPASGVTEEELSNKLEATIRGVIALNTTERETLMVPLFKDINLWVTGLQVVVFAICMLIVTTLSLIGVSERRREFATLSAIGASPMYLATEVVLENGLIGLLGSVLGIPLGIVGASTLTILYARIPLSIMIPGLFDLIPPTLLAQMVAETVTVCCLAGIIPALIASRANMAMVLREET